MRTGCKLHVGDVLDAGSLRGAGRDIETAYYLVHSMGRGGSRDFVDRERQGATGFAHMAREEGVQRIVYLGGLGENPQSEHLRSRQQTAEILNARGRRSPTSAPAWWSDRRASPTARCATWSSGCPR